MPDRNTYAAVLIAWALLVDASASFAATSTAEGTVLWIVGSTSDELRTLDAFEPRLDHRIGSGRWLFEIPLSTMVPVLEQRDASGRVALYNFRAVACLAAFGVNARIDAREDDWLVPFGGIASLLYLPNCDLLFRLTRSFRATLGLRTDLVAARPHRGERGAAVLPHLGLQWVGVSEFAGLQSRVFVEAGPDWWWSFEGASRATDLRIAAGFAVFVFR